MFLVIVLPVLWKCQSPHVFMVTTTMEAIKIFWVTFVFKHQLGTTCRGLHGYSYKDICFLHDQYNSRIHCNLSFSAPYKVILSCHHEDTTIFIHLQFCTWVLSSHRMIEIEGSWSKKKVGSESRWSRGIKLPFIIVFVH